MSKKVLIVGGVAGGASAAARLRRLDEEMEIIIFERGEHISYANCGLPYYVSGVIAERNALLVQTPEGMVKRFGIDVRIYSEVTRVFPEEKVVEVQEANGKIYRESYDLYAFNYLIKPLAEDKINEVLCRAVDHLNKDTDQVVHISFRGSLHTVRCSQILYLSSEQHSVNFCLKNDKDL